MAVLLEKPAGRLPAVEKSGPVDRCGYRGVNHGNSAVDGGVVSVGWVKDDLAPGRFALLASLASKSSNAMRCRYLRKNDELLVPSPP